MLVDQGLARGELRKGAGIGSGVRDLLKLAANVKSAITTIYNPQCSDNTPRPSVHNYINYIPQRRSGPIWSILVMVLKTELGTLFNLDKSERSELGTH